MLENLCFRVFLTIDENNENFALKKIRCTNFQELNKALEEVQSCVKLTHKNVVKTFKFFIEKSSYFTLLKKEETEYHLCILSEFCNSQTLRQYIASKRKKNKIIPIKIVFQILKQVVAALKYIHNKNIVHRDLKPSNLLLHKQKKEGEKQGTFLEVKICDFGFAKEFESTTQSSLGTPFFFSPEIRKNLVYGKSVDIWGIGAILLDLLSKKTLDYSYVLEIEREKVIDSILERYSDSKYKNHIKELINGTTAINPKERFPLLELEKKINIICSELDIPIEKKKKIVELEEEIHFLREENKKLTKIVQKRSISKSDKELSRFAEMYKHQDIFISKKGICCYKKKGKFITSMGNRNVGINKLMFEEKRYSMKLKYFNSNSAFNMAMIGIADPQKINFGASKSIGGSIKRSFGLFLRDGTIWYSKSKKKYLENKVISGDTFTILVDLKEQTLSFLHNDKFCGIAFENIGKPPFIFIVTLYSDTELFYVVE